MALTPPFFFGPGRSQMENGLDLLIRLQLLDREIERNRADLDRIPQEMKIAEAENSEARGEYEAVEAGLAGVAAAQKACEKQKEEGRVRLADYRNKLLSIRTNTEYRTMLDQIKFVEQSMDDLDSRTLELMYAEDEVRGKLDAARRKWEHSRDRAERKKVLLGERSVELKASLSELESRRADLAPSLNIRLLRKYEQLRSAGKRVAVVGLVRNACGGCMTNVPPQNAVEIEQGTTYNCPICGRFVVCSGDLASPVDGE